MRNAQRLAHTLSLVLCAAGSVGACARLPELGSLSHLAANSPPLTTLATDPPTPGPVPLHQLQLKGSHNSYHRAPRFALSRTWRYSHAPLEVQLTSQGVRQLELDVRYAHGELVVGHLPLVDGRSNCVRFRDCLARVKRWSRAHPSHLPIFIMVEVKDALAPARLDGRLDAIDSVIHRVLPRDMLLTPADVAGDAPNLRDAIITHGWPSVDQARGRIAFVMMGAQRHKLAYSAGRPRLEGRAMFVAEHDPARLHASVLIYDDPIAEQHEIALALAQHFLVRTRADSQLVQNQRRRDAALASGANFISTDFVDPRHNWLELGAAGRCSPLATPLGCTPIAVQERDSSALAHTALAPRKHQQ